MACSADEENTNALPEISAHVGCGPVLTTDKDWYTSGKRELLLSGLDGLHYAITTKSDSVQRYFDQGLVLAYGFNHAEAARSFCRGGLQPGINPRTFAMSHGANIVTIGTSTQTRPCSTL